MAVFQVFDIPASQPYRVFDRKRYRCFIIFLTFGTA